MFLLRQGLPFHCRHCSFIVFFLGSSIYVLAEFLNGAQCYCPDTDCGFIVVIFTFNFIGGTTIVIRIVLPSSLNANFACFVGWWGFNHRGVAFVGYFVARFNQLLMYNFCIDRCVGILLHLVLLHLPQSWPDSSNTGVCFDNLV